MQIINMDQVSKKIWTHSQLNTAINCLTYGIGCLYFDKEKSQLKPCILTIHEQYINIVHIIMEQRASFLFQLQQVKSISDKDIFIRQTLKAMNYEHFIIIYTSTLENYVLVMLSENQLNVLWEGLQYFIYQANNFYSRISLMDPFKAQTAMLFMNADVDGSKLLDIGEVISIFHKLKINKKQQQIEQSVKQINLQLYEKQNLKKPKDFSSDKLTTLGFQYILKYYSLKATIAPVFTQFCPIFKFRHKQFKKSIIDILKSQVKPLMSGSQFEQFLQKYIKVKKSQQQCIQLIKSFPVYDGQGKEIPQQVQFLSFHNFCNYIFSSTNSIMDPEKMDTYQDMTFPINEYFIYSSSNTYLSGNFLNSDSHLHMYQFSLKKGCRCVEIDIHVEKDQIVVKHTSSKRSILLVDVLKTIKNFAFSFNPFPIILSIQCNFPSSIADKVAQILLNQIGEYLYIARNKNSSQNQSLPSPQDLKNKMVLQLVGNAKRNKQEDNKFIRMITFMPTKLDFQRKTQTCWDTCQISVKDILKYEQIEDKNLTDYSRKILVRTTPAQTSKQLENYDVMPMFRNGIQIPSFNLKQQQKNHYFIHSKFIENGGRNCGYLLKPSWMRSNCLESLYATSFTRQIFILKVKVFAGQKFVLHETKMNKFFLQLYIKGTQIEELKNKKYVSSPVTEGFYTDFQMQCQFFIFCLDLAMLVMSIVDQNQQILSYRAIPISALRQGLRTVPLLGPGMQLHANSCLLVQSTIITERPKKKVSNLLI